MKKALLLLLILPSYIFGQDKVSKSFSVKVGQPMKSISTYSDVKSQWYYEENDYILTESNKIIELKTFKNDIYLRIIDGKTLKLISLKVYKQLMKDQNFIKVLKFSNKYYFVYSYINKKEKTKTIFFREVDYEKGILHDPVTIYSGKTLESSYFSSTLNQKWFPSEGGVIFNFSKDKSKLVLDLRSVFKEKKNGQKKLEYEQHTFIALDKELNKIWEKVDKVLYSYNLKTISSCIKNNGSYKIIKIDEKKGALLLYTISEDIDKPESVVLEQENPLNFSNIIMKENHSGNLVVVGIYGTSSYNLKAKGTFYLEIDNNDEIINEKHFPYDEDMYYQNEYKMKEYKIADQEKPEGKGLRSLSLRDFVLNEDGSFYVISEVQFDVWNSYREFYAYKHNNIVVSKFNNKIREEWTKKIPKFQRTTFAFGESTSFKYFINEGDAYFIYIDHDKNENLEPNVVPHEHFEGKGGIIRVVKLNEDGDLTNYPVLPMKNSIYGNFSFFQTQKVLHKKSDNSFLIELNQKGNEDVIIQIDVD